METYIITEKDDINTIREGDKVTVKSLTGAKRKATNMKVFQNTVLTVEGEDGVLICYKKEGEPWKDSEIFH